MSGWGCSTWAPAISTETLRGFPQSLQTNYEILPALRRDHFLPRTFQLLTYELSVILPFDAMPSVCWQPHEVRLRDMQPSSVRRRPYRPDLTLPREAYLQLISLSVQWNGEHTAVSLMS
jgi:hypothetical protein